MPDLEWPVDAALQTSSPAPTEIGVQWPAQADATEYIVTIGDDELTVDAPATSAIVDGLAPDTDYSVDVVATDGDSTTPALTAEQRTLEEAQPRDLVPVEVAPSPQTSTHDAATFLFTGPDPVQVGVQPGALNPERTGIISGRVVDRAGEPLEGVTVSVLHADEVGHTVTADDGQWDLAVNGGGQIVIDVTAPGYLPVQRTFALERGEWHDEGDIVLVPMDDESTVIPLDAEAPGDAFGSHVARTVVDTDGDRRARLLVRDGTSAELEFADGSTRPTDSLTVTITEYTEGDSGPEAMPGTMPDYIGYTYAVELTAAEAVAAGAIGVNFDQPVVLLTDNFLGIPVGAAVPTGTYDRQAGYWESQPDGIVMKMLGVDGEGRALVDVTGDEVADNDDVDVQSVLDDAELRELAEHYEVGDEFWRSELMHFSPQDLNYKWVVEPSVGIPEIPDVATPSIGASDPVDSPSTVDGYGTVEYENQTLRESLPVTGSDQTLSYSSARVAGRGATLSVPITGATVPAGAESLTAEIAIAGRTFTRNFSLSPNQSWTFTWDGIDSYGRQIAGPQRARLTLTYMFPGRYEVRPLSPLEWSLRALGFARPPTLPESLVDARVPYPVRRTSSFTMFGSDMIAADLGLGGWSLSGVHAYDASTGTLLRGDGTRERVGEVPGQFGGVESVVGTGEIDPACTDFGDPCGDGGLADDASMVSPAEVAYDLDGNLLVLTESGRRLRRVDASSGIITTIAGSGACLTLADPYASAPCDGEPVVDPPGCAQAGDPCGDGGPAVDAHFAAFDVEVGPDGSIYLLDPGTKRIRRILPDGTMTSIAGTGGDCASGEQCGDDGPAIDAPLGRPQVFTVGDDGSVYLTDLTRIRRVTPDGMIYTISDGNFCDPRYDAGPEFCGDGGPALDAGWFNIWAMAAMDDGSLLVVDETNRVIRRITPDGRIERWAGTYFQQPDPGAGYAGDSCTDRGWWNAGVGEPLYDEPCAEGQHRLETPLPPMTDIAVGTDGSVFVATGGWIGYCYEEWDPPEDLFEDYCGWGDYDNDGGFDDYRLLRIAPSGTVTRYAGTTELWVPQVGQFATTVPFDGQRGFALDPTDAPAWTGGYFQRQRVWRVGDTTPPIESGERFVPDGEFLHVFDTDGRHLRTQGLRTGTVLSSVAYDPAGRIASVTDRDGNVTTVERDQAGTPLWIESPYGDVTPLTIDGAGRLSEVANPEGETTTLGYRGTTGLLTSVAGAIAGAEYTFGYSGDGRLTSATDPDSNTTTIARSALAGGGRRIAVTTPSGDTLTFDTERADGGTKKISTTTGYNGATRVVTVDGRGRSTLETPDGVIRTTTFSPDPQYGPALPFPSQLVTTGDGPSRTERVERSWDRESGTGEQTFTERYIDGGATSELTWDSATSTRSTSTAEGRATVEVLDAVDRVATRSSDGLADMTLTYDTRGRLISRTDGEGATERTTTYGWDGADLTTITDAIGNEITHSYDDAGRVVGSELADDATIGVVRDLHGNATSYDLSSGASFEQGFDLLDRVGGFTVPGASPAPTRTTTYGYDVDGALARVDRADGTELTFTRDGQQLTGRQGDASTTTFTYDPDSGQMLSAATADATVSFAYDGALTASQTMSGAVAGTVTSTWNSSERLASETAGGITVGYGYDDDGLPTTVGDETVTYNAAGLVETRTLGNVEVNYEYDEFGQLARTLAVHDPSGAATVLFDEQLGRDDLGRVDARAETIGGATTNWTYGYDARGRFDEATEGGTTRSYGYDANSNLVSSPAGTGTYEADDRMTAFGTRTVSHDAAGDLTSVADGSDVTTFDIDAAGLLRGVDLPDGSEVEYLYDGLDRRVARVVDGITERSWIYRDGDSPAVELDGSGAVVTRFVYGVHGATPDYLVTGGTDHVVVSDFRGSPRLIVNAATGAVVQRLDFDELGAIVADSAPGTQPFGFQGGLVEPDTGLVRFGARDYDPSTGRFVSRDPILFAGAQANLFIYSNGDPINRSDPTGLGPAGSNVPTNGSPRTHSVGVDLSGTVGVFNVGVNISVAWDTQGDFGIQVSPSAGGSVGASVEGAVAYSNTSGNLKSGDGPSVAVGGIAGNGVGGGTSSIFNANGYAGQKYSAGIVAGASGNAESGYTFSLTKNDVAGAVTSARDSIYYAGLGVASNLGYQP